MVRQLALACSLLLLVFSSCGSSNAPTYSIQVTNVTPGSSSTADTSSTSSSLTDPPSSNLFQSWTSAQSKITMNFSPLAETLTNEVTYDTPTGDSCKGHVEFNAPATILSLTVDDGASDCSALNGNYLITVSANYLTLANSTNTFYFEN